MKNRELSPGLVPGPLLVVDDQEYFVQDGSGVGQLALEEGKHLIMRARADGQPGFFLITDELFQEWLTRAEFVQGRDEEN
jgi:hypothetical protein